MKIDDVKIIAQFFFDHNSIRKDVMMILAKKTTTKKTKQS